MGVLNQGGKFKGPIEDVRRDWNSCASTRLKLSMYPPHGLWPASRALLERTRLTDGLALARRLQCRLDDIDPFLSRERISDIGRRGAQEAAAVCPACDVRTLPKKRDRAFPVRAAPIR